MPLLKAQDLTKKFEGFTAVREVDFDLTAGEIKGVMGPNGAGKSTLLKLFSGHLFPTSGKIFFNNEEVSEKSVTEKSRKGIAYLSQRPSIFRALTVRENLQGSTQWSSMFSPTITHAKVNELLDLSGLADRASVTSGELSYGEMRILDLAMSLATQPTLLLGDEPTAGLDDDSTEQIIDLLELLIGSRYTGRFGLDGLILVEHVEGTLFDLADQLYFIAQGEIKWVGTPDLIRESPEVRAYLDEHKLKSDS